MFALWRAIGRRVASGLRVSGVVGLVALAVALASPRAFAESDAPRNEIFTGFEVSDNYASAYLGGGYAFGKGLYAPGWRLRSVPVTAATTMTELSGRTTRRPSSTARNISARP